MRSQHLLLAPFLALGFVLFACSRQISGPHTAGTGAAGASVTSAGATASTRPRLTAAASDSEIHPPPGTGLYAYNSFVPDSSYVDPVFGSSIARLTEDHGKDDLYARNMWWSADGSRYLHRVCCGTDRADPGADYWNVIDVATGRLLATHVPDGDLPQDGGFDPVDSDLLYYFLNNELHGVRLDGSGGWQDSVLLTAPAPFLTLGGTLNWLDAQGRSALLRYGPEPSVHLYDRSLLGAGPFANPIDASASVERNGYLGLTPDGRYIVGFDDTPGDGLSKLGQGLSWEIDFAGRAIAPSPHAFWSLCGDHGSFLSGSDGGDYMITFDCYGENSVWRVNVANDAGGLGEQEQQSLTGNQRLLALPSWNLAGHLSTVARGDLRDWAFLSVEDGTDTLGAGVADANGMISSWPYAYRSELVALETHTGEVRRLAHHRSRSVFAGDYYAEPRVSASWGGEVVGFASNFDQPGVDDVFALAFSSAPLSPPAPPAPPQSSSGPVSWTNVLNATASGSTLTKSGSGSCDGCDNSGGDSVQSLTGAGSVEFSVVDSTDAFNAGLAEAGSPGFAAYINFQGGFAQVYQGSAWECGTAFAAGDEFALAVSGGVVSYQKNGQEFCSLPLAGSYPLIFRASLWSLGATVTGATITAAP